MSDTVKIVLPLENDLYSNLIELSGKAVSPAEIVNSLRYEAIVDKDGKPGPGKYELRIATVHNGTRIVEVNQLLDGEGKNKDRIANLVITDSNGDVYVQLMPRYLHAGFKLELIVEKGADPE